MKKRSCGKSGFSRSPLLDRRLKEVTRAREFAPCKLVQLTLAISRADKSQTSDGVLTFENSHEDSGHCEQG